MALVYVGLGSNLGNRLEHLVAGAKALLSIGELKDCSSVWETSAWGPISQAPFLNCVLSLETRVLPTDLIRIALRIEYDLGRKRMDLMGGPRTIDIDMLLYGTSILATPDLTLPHPRLHKRRFVLLPLSEIAPDLVHPGLQKGVKEMLQELESEETCHLFIPADSFKESIGTLRVS
jgi:2-amino-4-hydroxy-6-hydroxymethyldihydropteridine diphosphokinase